MAMVMLWLSATGVYAQQPARVTVDLRRSTPVSVQLTSIASSDKKNDVTAIVAADVINQETREVLIKRGTPVVVTADRLKSKGMGKGGSITVNPISTTSVDGQTIMLMGNSNKTGENTSTALVLGLVMGLVVLPVVGFLFFLLHGEKVNFPPNTLIPNVGTADDYQIVI